MGVFDSARASSSSTLSKASANETDPPPRESARLAALFAASALALISSSASLASSSSAAAASDSIAACAAASHAAAASASAPVVSRGVHSPLCSRASSSVAGALARGDFLIPTRGENPPDSSTFSAMFSELPGDRAKPPATTSGGSGDDLGDILGVESPNTDCSCESIASMGDVGVFVPFGRVWSGGGRPRWSDEIHRSRSSTVPARITRTLYPCVLQHSPYSRCM